jgi:hypothetical protein
VGWG